MRGFKSRWRFVGICAFNLVELVLLHACSVKLGSTTRPGEIESLSWSFEAGCPMALGVVTELRQSDGRPIGPECNSCLGK